MNCPHCGQYVQDPYATTCPRCGQALADTAWAGPSGETPSRASYPSTPSRPLSTPGQTSPGGYGGYGAYGQPSSPSQWGAPAPGSGYGTAPGQSGGPWPAQGAPGYGPAPYGQPPYGQYAPPSYPMAYAPPSGAPPAWGAPPPYAPVPAPRRSRTGLIVGVVVAAVLVLVAGVGAAGVYLVNQGANNTASSGNATAIAATPTPVATVIFQDALTADNGGWAVDPPHCQYANGGYLISNNYICYAPAGIIGDATISAQAKQVQGPTTSLFGIALRRVSRGNFYVFEIDSNSEWDFVKAVNGNATEIVSLTQNAAIKGGLNVANTLLVRSSSSHFDFFVNGTKVGQADDSTYSSGKAGLAAGDTMQVVYNNFNITKP